MGGFLAVLLRDDSGQDATEYVLLVVLIALAAAAGMIILAGGINIGYNNASQTLNAQAGS